MQQAKKKFTLLDDHVAFLKNDFAFPNDLVYNLAV